MRNSAHLDSPTRKSISQFKATAIDYDNINRYNVDTLLNFARQHEIAIPDNPSKQEIICALNYSRDQSKKSISFCAGSPKRYRMPESFKSIPKPMKFGDENSFSQQRLSPILSNKRKNVSIPFTNHHQMPCTPAAKFRTAFHEKSQGAVSPVINSLAGSIKKTPKESPKSVDTCASFPFFISFFLSGSVVTIIMLSVL